jgi:hypothetical protein
MSDAAATLTHEGVEYSGASAEALRSELGIEAPPPAAEAKPAVDAKAEPPAKVEEPPKPATAQETHDRIQRLTWEREEANRQRDAAKAELDAARKPKAEPSAKPSPQAEVARFMAMPGAPKLDDKDEAGNDLYPDFHTFSAAQALFIADQRFEERQAALDKGRATESRATAAQERHRAFNGRLTEAKKADATLDGILANSTAQIDQGPMAYVITTSEHGVAIMKFLAQHPERAGALVNIPDDMERYAQMRALETEVRLTLKPATAPPGSAQADPATKVATKAEPPINPVGSSPVSITDADAPPGDDASDDDWFKWRCTHNIDGSRKASK